VPEPARGARRSPATATPVATLLKVRAACYALRYRTDDASDSNLAQLQECLQKYPSVAGIDFTDSGDS
jgi:hypothetical protein